MMQRYRHLPTEIQATRWFPNMGLLPQMIDITKRDPGKRIFPRYDVHGNELAALIEGQAGYHMVKAGDYVCRGANGELFSVPPEIFQPNYELIPGQHRQPVHDHEIEQRIAETVQSAVDGKV